MTESPVPSRPLAAVATPSVREATDADRALLAELLAGLSPASAYQRFLTGRSAPTPGLLTALLPERPAGGAVLAFLGTELVGHALWARLPDAAAAEIAIVVADRHQRRGIGTALAWAVIDDLASQGVGRVEVFSSTDNRAVARMIARQAPGACREFDGPTTTWSFPAPSGSSALPRTA
jgi:GNAT superfamily N-acetyltransferase